MVKTNLYLILHNIRSALNVGSIFRTADAARVAKIFICGYTPTPNHKKVVKTSLGAEISVPWEQHRQTWRLIKKLRQSGVLVTALEQSKKSIDYRRFNPPLNRQMVLILGNEVKGLSKKILDYCDKTIEIPMYGKKESLNVSVAAGIAIFKIIEKIPTLTHECGNK